MTRRDVFAVLGVAAVTMAFTLAAMGPDRVDAVDAVHEPLEIKPLIATPKLSADGCEFTVTTDKPTYQQGEAPTLRIRAVNPSQKAVETTVWVSISADEIASFISRVPKAPEPVWSHKCLVQLGPGEEKEITLETEAELSVGQMVSVTLSHQDLSILAQRLNVAGSNGGSQPAVVPSTANTSVELPQTSPLQKSEE